MDEAAILRERAQNLWVSFSRKVEAVGQATRIEPTPDFELGRIGGLEGPKEEIQTYACAATSPEVYERWGTYPPSGLLLIGRRGVGKTLLARALSSLTRTSFLNVAVPPGTAPSQRRMGTSECGYWSIPVLLACSLP